MIMMQTLARLHLTQKTKEYSNENIQFATIQNVELVSERFTHRAKQVHSHKFQYLNDGE